MSIQIDLSKRKIKACPFCGRIKGISAYCWSSAIYSVSCPCGCEAPINSKSLNAAIRKWNLRRPPREKTADYSRKSFNTKIMFKVKLLPSNTAQPDQHISGYLASNGSIQEYTRGEAIKKARLFGGKIESTHAKSLAL